MSELHLFLQHLSQPEYVHVLLNPLPVYGMAARSFVLGVSVFKRNAKEQTAALLWIGVVSLLTWAAIQYGEKGYDRVLSMSTSADAQQWLKVHMDRATRWELAFYLPGLAALLALRSRKRWPRFSERVTLFTLLASWVSIALAAWISHAGGQVRHSEFRDGPPSADQLPKEGRSDTH
jgi:hypothetical protein